MSEEIENVIVGGALATGAILAVVIDNTMKLHGFGFISDSQEKKDEERTRILSCQRPLHHSILSSRRIVSSMLDYARCHQHSELLRRKHSKKKGTSSFLFNGFLTA